MNREEVKVRVREKKIKRALRKLRFRSLKNFMFWFAGVLSSFAIIAGAIFIGVKVVPISTYAGGAQNGIVSDKVASKSILDAIMQFETFGFSDFPIVEDTVRDLMETQNEDGTKLSDYITVDYDKLNAISFSGDFSSGLTECLSFNKDGIKNALGEEKQIEAFTEYTSVSSPELDSSYQILETRKAGLYYYYDDAPSSGLASDDNGEGGKFISPYVANPMNATPTFKPAFNEDGTLIDALKEQYDQGTLKLYYRPLLDFPITEAFGYIMDYLEVLKVNEILQFMMAEGTDQNKVLLTQIFKGVAIGDLFKQTDNDGLDIDTFMGNITLDGISENGISELLGAFGNFSFFKEFKVVDTADRPELDVDNVIVKDEDKNFVVEPKLFYVELSAEIFVRAFSDEGELIKFFEKDDQIYTEADKPAGATEVSYADLELCYANLAKVPLSEVFDLIDDFLFGEKIVDIISTATGGDASDLDGTIMNVFGDNTIKDMLDFDFTEIKLVDVLGSYEDAEEGMKGLYDLLCSIVVVEDGEERPTADTLSFGDLLNGFAFDDVKISDLPVEIDEETLDLICSLIKVEEGEDKPTSDTLTLGHLFGGFDFDGVVLSDLLEDMDEETLDLICSLVKVEDGEERPTAETLTIGHLMGGLDFEGVAISDLPISFDETTLQLLCDAINTEREKAAGTEPYDVITPATITLADITEISPEYIKLTSILPYVTYSDQEPFEEVSHNRMLYKVLLLSSGYDLPNEDNAIKALAETLTVSDIKLDLDNIPLSLVLEGIDEESMLYKLLDKAFETDGGFDEITINDLSSLDITDVTLSTVLTDITAEDMLYKILDQAFDVYVDGEKTVDKTFGDIKISDLSNLDVSNVALSTVLTELDSDDMLYQLLDQAFAGKGGFDEITINDLSSLDITSVALSTVLTDLDSDDMLYKLLDQAFAEKGGFDEITINDLSSLDITGVALSTVLTDLDSDDMLYKLLDQAFDVYVDGEKTVLRNQTPRWIQAGIQAG